MSRALWHQYKKIHREKKKEELHGLGIDASVQLVGSEFNCFFAGVAKRFKCQSQ